jgi:hypothetical protein
MSYQETIWTTLVAIEYLNLKVNGGWRLEAGGWRLEAGETKRWLKSKKIY